MAYGFGAFEGSGKKATGTDAVIKASAGILGGVLIGTNGTDDALVVLYDNTAEGSGTELFRYTVAGGDNNEYVSQLKHFSGCWLVITGTGAWCIVDVI